MIIVIITIMKIGWLLGQNKTPLYGAPTEALASSACK